MRLEAGERLMAGAHPIGASPKEDQVRAPENR